MQYARREMHGACRSRRAWYDRADTDQELIRPLKPKRQTRSTSEALQRTLMTMLLVIGSVLPVAIAFVLVASTNDDNPLDKIPNYEDPPTEVLTIPFNSAEPVTTEFKYQHRVRLFIEGAGQIGEASIDAFYQYGDGAPIPMVGLEINDQPALDALDLVDDPPTYEADHLYPVIYEAGPDLEPLSIRFVADLPGDPVGVLTITVVQLTD